MIRQWYNTNAATMAEMLDVTDKSIREASNGRFDCQRIYETDYEAVDPEIFGKEKDNDNLLMGHIELPVAVVNVQYSNGKRPILAKKLGMDQETVEKIMGYCLYVVTESRGGYEYKQTLTLSEYDTLCSEENFPKDCIVTGGAAIEALLAKDGVAEKDNIILHCMPILPLCMRFHDNDVPTGVQRLTITLVCRAERIEKLIGFEKEHDGGFPRIIMLNECRMLQEAADNLINNGARSFPKTNGIGQTLGSMNELSNCINDLVVKKEPNGMPEEVAINEETVRRLIRELEGIRNECPCDDEKIAEIPEIYEEDEGTRKWRERKESKETEIIQYIQPFMSTVIEKNFDTYCEDYMENMLECAERGVYGFITAASEHYEELENENVIEWLVAIICDNVYNFTSKRVVYA